MASLSFGKVLPDALDHSMQGSLICLFNFKISLDLSLFLHDALFTAPLTFSISTVAEKVLALSSTQIVTSIGSTQLQLVESIEADETKVCLLRICNRIKTLLSLILASLICIYQHICKLTEDIDRVSVKKSEVTFIPTEHNSPIQSLARFNAADMDGAQKSGNSLLDFMPQKIFFKKY